LVYLVTRTARVSKCSCSLMHSHYSYASLKSLQLHYFADASTSAALLWRRVYFRYGVVTYLKTVSCNKQIHCAFLFGKGRLVPTKTVSVFRLELTAATLAVKINGMIKREMQSEDCEAVYWTGSTAVLQMISNTSKRFPTFVSNRIAKIEVGLKPDQWRYIGSKLNPADCASRGLSAKPLVSSSQWLTAPEFLWQVEDRWPSFPCQLSLLPDEFTVLSQQTYSVHNRDENCTTLADCFTRVSSWYRLKRAIA